MQEEVVDPLPEPWQRELAATELVHLIAERTLDMGVNAKEVRIALSNFSRDHGGGVTYRAARHVDGVIVLPTA